MSPTTVGIAAAARYLQDSEFKGKVALTGLGAPSQMKTFIEDGTVTEFALWNPDQLGYLAAYTADALVKGDISGEEACARPRSAIRRSVVCSESTRAAVVAGSTA